MEGMLDFVKSSRVCGGHYEIPAFQSIYTADTVQK